MKYDSISDYLEETKYDEIFNAILGYYNDNKNHIYLTTYAVPNPLYIKLIDISVSKVYFKDNIYDEKDEFKIVVDAEFTLKGDKSIDYEEDTKYRKFIVTCSGIFNKGLKQFKIIEVDEYSSRPYNNNGLSEFLIPYISKDDLEDRAEMFLKKYYEEALTTPMQLPIKTILDKMNVKVYNAPLGRDIFGKSFFLSSREQVYNDDNEVEEIEIGPRTILVEPNVAFFRNIGSYNNTVIHECVHIEFHSKFFELQSILSNPIKSIISSFDKGQKNIKSSDLKALSIMEWQASMLAPRILMPANTTRIMYDRLLDEIEEYYPNYSAGDKLELLIEKISDFFNVSKQAAKIRLIDLGYTNATGVGNYINGEKVPNYTVNDNIDIKNRTYVIDFIDSIRLIRGNEHLRRLSQKSKITYVNGFVVINSPKYVEVSSMGTKSLTAYALNNIHECAFVFKRRKTETNNYYYEYLETMHFLCRPENKKTYVPADYDDESTNNKKLIQYGDYLDDTLDSKEILKKMNGEFHEDFNVVIQELGLLKDDGTPNYYQISKETLISDHTIKSYLTGKSKPQKEKLMAICGGLCLHTRIAYKLFEKAGISMTNSMTDEDLIYCSLIERHYDEGLENWNKYLKLAKKTMLP